MREAAHEVVRQLQEAGYEAYWVGGCVRDLQLGVEPEDYDVATSAPPGEAASVFERTREVGRSFGVLQVLCAGHWFEVATFRTESGYSDSRHPDHVQFTDRQRDASRRDFTINALYYDPVSGALHDDVGGVRDLRERRLRSVGDPERRFEEDALRLLRAARFAARYALDIEPRTHAAIRSHASRIQQVAAERVRDELLAMLVGPSPARALTLLWELGVLEEIAGEIVRLRGCTQSPQHHPEGDVWVHTLAMLDAMPAGDAELALGVLLHDIGKPDTRTEAEDGVRFYRHAQVGCDIAGRMLDRWRVSGRTRTLVLQLIDQHLRFLDVPQMRRSTLRRFVLQENFTKLLELHRLDSTCSNGNLQAWRICRRERQDLGRDVVPVRPLLNGHELQNFGWKAGPALGAVLRELLDAQLEGVVVTRDDAIAWARARTPEGGGKT